jgi:hypothetical protein
MSKWLEALNAPDLGIVIAGNHYAATQSMDEEHRQNVTYSGAFGTDGPVSRSVRKADDATVSFSAILLKPGQGAGMDDETFMYSLKSFSISCRRGTSGQPSDWHIYDDCAWNTIHVASTLDQVMLTADMSVPTYTGPGMPATNSGGGVLDGITAGLGL